MTAAKETDVPGDSGKQPASCHRAQNQAERKRPLDSSLTLKVRNCSPFHPMRSRRKYKGLTYSKLLHGERRKGVTDAC